MRERKRERKRAGAREGRKGKWEVGGRE